MPDVAAFDFDGTLTERGSVFGYLSALRGPAVLMPAALALAPRLLHAAVAGGRVADLVKEDLFERVLAGVALERAEEVGAQFVDRHLDRHLRPAVRRRFDWHRDRGDKVVIVSASPEVYVKVAGERLGADGVVATRLAVNPEGALTGRYEGANCRGSEKIIRLRQWIDDSGGLGGRLWAYGNSRGDLTMLGAADIGVNVGRLGRLGQLRSFPGLDRHGAGKDPGLNARRRSEVLLLPHPDQDEPSPDGGQVGGEQALHEDGGHRVGLADPGCGEADDHPGLDHPHASRHR